jgi:hypothetical protein
MSVHVPGVRPEADPELRAIADYVTEFRIDSAEA